MSKITWKKVEHKVWSDIQTLLPEMRNIIYRWQYKGFVDGKDKYSIIGPSQATFGQWEAHMGNGTPRFSSLKEAKQYCKDHEEF